MKNNSIDLTSLLLQVYSIMILMQDYNNGDLMNELQIQDEKYLKQILKNQQQILEILKERGNKSWKIK